MTPFVAARAAHAALRFTRLPGTMLTHVEQNFSSCDLENICISQKLAPHVCGVGAEESVQPPVIHFVAFTPHTKATTKTNNNKKINQKKKKGK